MIKKITDYYSYLKSKRYDTLAGTLSFYFVLCIIPLLYLSLSLYLRLGKVLHLETPLPEIISQVVDFDLHAGVSIFFLLTTIYSASSLFLHLRRTGEIIYGIKKPQKSIRSRIFSCFIVILSMFIVAFAMLGLSIVEKMLADLSTIIIFRIITASLLYLLLFAFLVLINQYATTKKLSFKQMKKGVIFTILYITIVSIIFFLYVTLLANYTFLYGYLSTAIIVLLYIYFMMKGVVAGIIINQKNL